MVMCVSWDRNGDLCRVYALPHTTVCGLEIGSSSDNNRYKVVEMTDVWLEVTPS